VPPPQTSPPVDPTPIGAFGASIAPKNIFGLTPLAGYTASSREYIISLTDLRSTGCADAWRMREARREAC